MLLKLNSLVLFPCLFLFVLGALPVLGLLNNLQLLYINVLISLVFMLLMSTFCLHLVFILFVVHWGLRDIFAQL